MRFPVSMATNIKMIASRNIKSCNLVEVGLHIALMMEVVRTSETSFYFNETTRWCIPEGRTGPR
jgi:hypothetical protein